MPRRTRKQVEAIKREREEEDLAVIATPFLATSEDAGLVPPKRKRGRARKSEAMESAAAVVDDTNPASTSTQAPTPYCSVPHQPPAPLSNETTAPPSYCNAISDHSAYPAASSSSQPIVSPFEPPLKPVADAMAKVEKPQAKKARKSSTVAEGSLGGPSEFRPARIRQKAPQATMQRMERVMSQRMFMMDRARIRDGETPAERFAVLGSTGNAYTVIIDHSPTCDCPDCLKGNAPCKHIVFIFLKVLKLPVTSTIWYQKGLTPSELKHVFEQSPPNPNDPHHVPATVRKAYLKATGRGDEVEEVVEEIVVPVKPKREVIGEDCPVCYEEMTEEEVQRSKLVFDESAGGCGNALHSECFSMWAATARAKGDEITCVYCRTPWAGANGSAGGKGKATAGVGGSQYSSLGYLNLADVAGVSRQRDTSSYYHGPMAGVRTWQNRYADD